MLAKRRSRPCRASTSRPAGPWAKFETSPRR
jgi:hypothetical protein